MDRTGWIVVILCVIGMVLYYPRMMRDMERTRAADQAAREAAAEAAAQQQPESSQAPGEQPTSPDGKSPAGTSIADGGVEEEKIELVTEAVRFHLSNLGGGIAEAELLDHAASLGSDDFITLNDRSSIPIGAIHTGPGGGALRGFNVVSKNQREVVFEQLGDDGVRIRKRYYLEEDAINDGYLIRLDLTFTNEGDQPWQQSDLSLFVGSAAPLHPKEWPQQTGFFWRDDSDMRYKDVNYFGSKGFLGMEFRGAKEYLEEFSEELHWSGVMDQFFTIIVATVEPVPGPVWGSRFEVALDGQPANAKKKLYAAQGGFGLPQLNLAPGQTTMVSTELYLGPKEYQRLNALGDNRREVMNYGNFPVLGLVVAPVSRILVKALGFLYGVVGNYGVAIIIITFCIRILIWPLHAKSTRTMKRMAALSPKMTEMREKYKDDPQRLNQEMMQLYRDYGVNPLGGCLPVFLQLPIFLGFYRMLQSAVELRHESFLWVSDLSMPDTLFVIPIAGGIPFNVMPLLMGVTMVLQMKVAPKSGDKTQQRIFMFMPLIFLVICYNFASALSLYWTAQNIFSIGQTWLMGRMPEPELEKKAAKAKKPGSFADLMDQAKKRTQVSGQGPSQTKKKKRKKK